MDQTLRYAAVVAGGGLAACLLLFALPMSRGGDAPSEAVVVTLPPNRVAHPATPLPSKPFSEAPAAPREPVPIGRQLQIELKRVGCYEGSINGQWNAATRQAMKAFTEVVNARLPVDRPDPVLLALVQNYVDRACTASCDDGQQASADGRCSAQHAAIQEPPASAEAPKPETRTPAPSAGASAIAAAATVSAAAVAPRVQVPSNPPAVATPGFDGPPAPASPPAQRQGATASHPEPSATEPKKVVRTEGPAAKPATVERRARRTGGPKYPSIQMVFRQLKRAAINALPLP